MELTEEAVQIEALASKIALVEKPDNFHFQAVRAQCAAAYEVFVGILCLVDEDNGVSAQSLLRTLFETVVGAVILAKHSEKVLDFGMHARLTWFRAAKARPEGSPAIEAFPSRAAAEKEYPPLRKHFTPSRYGWYLLDREEAFAEAEVPEGFYAPYYKVASAIAHGEALTVFQSLDAEMSKWTIMPLRAWRTDWPTTVYTLSLYLMLHMIDRVSKYFDLGLDGEAAAIKRNVNVTAARLMENLPSEF